MKTRTRAEQSLKAVKRTSFFVHISLNYFLCAEGEEAMATAFPSMESCLSLQESSEVGNYNASGSSRISGRGHWRPAEDSKLKELVELYGPQNWNLIAGKLEGRSGIVWLNKFYPTVRLSYAVLCP